MKDLIYIDRLSFDGRHGALPFERDTGVRFQVDLEMQADLAPSCRTDSLGDTVDYGHVAALVTEIGAQRSFHLVERLADEIATSILERFVRVEAVTVIVRKLVPVVSGHPESVGVRIHRTR